MSPPTKDCGSQRNEFCYDVERKAVLAEITDLYKFENAGGEEEFLSLLLEAAKLLLPVIKSFHSKQCVSSLNSEMKSEYDNLKAIDNVQLNRNLTF